MKQTDGFHLRDRFRAHLGLAKMRQIQPAPAKAYRNWKKFLKINCNKFFVMPTQIRISDIGLYLRCPRLVYFDSMGKLQRKNNARQLILKSLMLGIVGGTDLEVELKESLARLEQELPMVYEIEPEEIGQACRELEGRIPEISASLLPHLHLLVPSVVEVDLRSEKMGLSGRPKCSRTR